MSFVHLLPCKLWVSVYVKICCDFDWDYTDTTDQVRASQPLHSTYFLPMNMECHVVCQFLFQLFHQCCIVFFIQILCIHFHFCIGYIIFRCWDKCFCVYFNFYVYFWNIWLQLSFMLLPLYSVTFYSLLLTATCFSRVGLCWNTAMFTCLRVFCGDSNTVTEELSNFRKEHMVQRAWDSCSPALLRNISWSPFLGVQEVLSTWEVPGRVCIVWMQEEMDDGSGLSACTQRIHFCGLARRWYGTLGCSHVSEGWRGLSVTHCLHRVRRSGGWWWI